MDPNKLRSDFPQLKDRNFHYLDSAASSLTPARVIDAVDDYYRNYRANVHRALYREAVDATEHYEAARAKVAQFIGAKPEEIIFTSGATEGSNMLAGMLEHSSVLKENGTIVTSEMEHHAALVPLQEFAKRSGRALHYIPLSGIGLDHDAAAKLIDGQTVLVSVMLASNVTGTINDIRTIADIARKADAIMVVDATAAVGHIPVDVNDLGADALYFSGHKMLAPTGVGVLWVKTELLKRLSPAVFGGHMIAEVTKEGATWGPVPERFEPGTKNIGGVIGLGAAIDYLGSVGLPAIRAHTAELVSDAIAKLEQIHGVHVFAERDPSKNAGVVSFVADFAHPHDLAEILARHRVAVRPGHHCALPLHHALGVNATTRASFHLYNNAEDITALVEGIHDARRLFS